MSTAPIRIDVSGMKSIIDNNMKDLGNLRMICGEIIYDSTENSNQNRRKKLEQINTSAKYMERYMDKIYQQLMALRVSLGFMDTEGQA